MIERFSDLTEEERRLLAHTARSESSKQDDWRYQDADPEQRYRLKGRWREIADALHPDPYSSSPGHSSPSA